MQDNIFNHDKFNTWLRCKQKYYYKYVKKLDLPDFNRDYELGKSVHAIIDYYLRGLDVEFLLKGADSSIIQSWELIKNHSLLQKKLIATEWGFDVNIANSCNWLVGRIDAIFYDRERKKYIIADWKTGKNIPKNYAQNFQHKVYSYAFFRAQQDLKLAFEQRDLVFWYVKIAEDVEIKEIEFSQEKEKEYEMIFKKYSDEIQNAEVFNKPVECSDKHCPYLNICQKL